MEVTSRFTWQLPQTITGLGFSNISNWAWQVDKVDYWGGATVLSGNFFGNSGAVTLGSYINGSRYLRADPHNSLFQHEYGHYLQSQSMGWAYFPRVGIPSIMGAAKYDDGNHDFQPYEQDANRRAFNYFNKNVKGFYQTEAQWINNQRSRIRIGWDFRNNPLDVYHKGKNMTRYYYNSADMVLVNSLALRAKWYDYFDPFGIIIGTGNGLYYNKYRIR